MAGLAREIFGGDLRDVSLNSLLLLARAEAVRGWIRIAPRGEVSLVDGRVVGARCGPLTGADALRELLFHDVGHFALVRGEPSSPCIIEDTTAVVMDAYRLRDEWARLSTAVLRPSSTRAWRPTGGPLDAVVHALDGQRTLADAVAAQDGAVTPYIDPVLAALNDGLIERVRAPRESSQRTDAAGLATPPAPRITSPSPWTPARAAGPSHTPPQAVSAQTPAATQSTDDVDFFELIDRGRAQMRASDYDAAERSLRRALELRPGDRVVMQNLRALAQRRGDTVASKK